MSGTNNSNTIAKNDEFNLTIEDMSTDGAGIGRRNGFVWFVKDAVTGDVVTVRATRVGKSYGFARLMKIITPSRQRTEPRCPVAKQCGGCQLQMMDYHAQLRMKENMVKNDLIRIGGIPEEEINMKPILGMEEPWRYRNKAQFPIGRDREGRIIAGFYAARSHRIVECRDCLLGVTENKKILDIIIRFMEDHGIEPYDEERHKGLVRHVLIRKGFATGELMVCIVINGTGISGRGGEDLGEMLTKQLLLIPGMTSITLNVNREKTNVILGDRIINLYGEGYITDYIGSVKYHISPLSFYQVNPVQTEKLYGTALAYADLKKGTEVVWDLYCGIGTISLFLAQKAGKVYGVEIVPEAIRDARENAALNGLANTEFFVGKAEEVLPEQYEKNHVTADVIVVDPPRKGLEQAVMDTMLRMAPRRIVYVSCNPATLARDLRYLLDGGYRLKKVRCCDMFPHASHVETVCLLSKLC